MLNNANVEKPRELYKFFKGIGVDNVQFIPISALHGDNVVTRSLAMPWYQGPSLLYHLEHVYIGSDRNLIDARFPVAMFSRTPREPRSPTAV